MTHHLIPRNATIDELEKKAAKCDREAAIADEVQAAKLRDEAALCREWVIALRRGHWTS